MSSESQRADILKEEGNELFKASKFHDAVEKYTQAIKLNRDPAYFCNRAAAYCRLEQYDLAVQDCLTALELDEKYAKAYGRMGLALSCQNLYEAAIESYKKAIELDPNNENYKSNLAIAEEKVREANQRSQSNPGANLFAGLGNLFGAGVGAGGAAAGGPDLGALLNNPAIMNAAMQMMNDPNMQNLMGSMMEQFMGGSSGGASGSLTDLLAAGQNMAQQMQEANPELVEQLRQQFAGSSTDDGNNQQNQGSSTPQVPDIEQLMSGLGAGGSFADFVAAGQNMAQQMQQANPELIEQLRQQFAGSSSDDGNNQQNQDDTPQDPDNQQQ